MRTRGLGVCLIWICTVFANTLAGEFIKLINQPIKKWTKPDGTYVIEYGGSVKAPFQSRWNYNDLNLSKAIISARRHTHSAVDHAHPRIRRSVTAKLTCTLDIQTDPFVWKYYMRKNGQDRDMARYDIVSMVTDHVKTANEIFNNTTFTDNGVSFTGVNLQIRRIQVMTIKCPDVSSSYTVHSTMNHLCATGLSHRDLLFLFSTKTHDEYCLSYLFTHRDFTEGTVGHAWTASETDRLSGVCGRYSNNSIGGHSISTSCNTGLVTLVHSGQTLARERSHLNFVHQLGHSFGASHDDVADKLCSPDGPGGLFIMDARNGITGDHLNNHRFSPCSARQIATELVRVTTGNGKRNCFQHASRSSCGNNIVEEGEECDCGSVNDCKESCCNADRCTLKQGDDCSPSQGPCCSSTCTYRSPKVTCKRRTDCISETKCTGYSSHCHATTSQYDGRFCNNYTGICKNGECAGSLCEKIGRKQCSWMTSTSPGRDRNMFCILACENERGECISSKSPESMDFRLLVNSINQTGVPEGHGVALLPGSACKEGSGTCDGYMRCITDSRSIYTDTPAEIFEPPISSPVPLKSSTEGIEGHLIAQSISRDMSCGTCYVLGITLLNLVVVNF